MKTYTYCINTFTKEGESIQIQRTIAVSDPPWATEEEFIDYLLEHEDINYGYEFIELGEVII